MNKKDTVTSEQRSAIKRRIDAIGRTRFCETSGMRYTTITQKLNGQLPLSPEDYNLISSICDKLTKSK